jgi:hypothetical protein
MQRTAREEFVMRLMITLPLALAAAVLLSSPASAADCAPGRTVPYRPRAWSPPPLPHAARVAPGITEGDPAAEANAAGLVGPARAARSGIVVEMRPDGSRRAVLGGAIRMWSVASVDEHGRLQLECVGSEAAAMARADSAGTRRGN